MIVTKESIDQLCRLDSTFQLILEKYGPPPNWQRDKGFESLCQIILEQQVSLASAKASFNKLNYAIKSVTPENIKLLAPDRFRELSITRQKRDYLKSLSEKILTQEFSFEKLELLNAPEIYSSLIELKGIGPWTANIYLIFCHQSPDIYPPGDVALINTIKELKEVTKANSMDTITFTWSPFRSLASFFLWHYYLSKRGRKAEY